MGGILHVFAVEISQRAQQSNFMARMGQHAGNQATSSRLAVGACHADNLQLVTGMSQTGTELHGPRPPCQGDYAVTFPPDSPARANAGKLTSKIQCIAVLGGGIVSIFGLLSRRKFQLQPPFDCTNSVL